MILPHLQMYHLERLNNPRRQIAFTFHYLAKLGAVTQTDLKECQQLLLHLLNRSLQEHPLEASPLVVGLAESGILLSALMHQTACHLNLDALWICSTRRPASGLQFIERHSHGPTHILPLPKYGPLELWIVEDEFTTGRTVLQVTLQLSQLLSIERVRLFTLADARRPQHKRYFQHLLETAQIRYSIHSLLQLERDDSYLSPELSLNGFSKPLAQEMLPIVHHPDVAGWSLPTYRPALQAQREFGILQYCDQLSGTLLVVGEAMDLAARIISHNPHLSLRHATRSPWKVDQENIFSRWQIDDHFYLYNFSEADSPIHILSDKVDAQTGLALQKLLQTQGYTTNILEL